MLKVGQGFGTWLIPIIIFGVLGSVAIMSLIVLVCAYYCRSRRRITDRKPQMTHEIYRTPTMPYKNPSVRPVDPTIGRLITHSRSLHVVSRLIYLLNRLILISTSLAIKRSIHTASDPKSVLQNYAILLNLHHTRIEPRLYPHLVDIQGRKVRYTSIESLIPDIYVPFLSDPCNYLRLLRIYPHDQKDVSLLLHQVHIPQVVCLWKELRS